MKNVFLKILAISLMIFSFSCSEHDDIPVFEESLVHFMKETQTATYDGSIPSGDNKIVYYVTNKVTSSHSVELVFDSSASTAVLGTDFQILSGTDELASGESQGEFVIKVLPAGGISGKKAIFTVKSNTLGSAGFKNKITVTLAAFCPSSLAGTYTYSTTNYAVPGSPVVTTPTTGTVTIAATNVAGEYTISDGSFGVYALYGELATGLKLKDSCGKLSYAEPRTNQYGDKFTLSNVTVNGSQLMFHFTSDYQTGEYGDVTLTRTDGTSWPSNLN